MSESTADTVEDTVLFPPREHADFVIHYDNTAFHVHKLILHHHSAYFRAYFQSLSRSSENSSTGPSSERSKRCCHPSITHCIDLPQQITLVEQTAVTAADLQLFLRHLYFSHHYCYPPYLPKTDIDLDAHNPPLSLAFPPTLSLDWSESNNSQLRPSVSEEPASFRQFTVGDQLDARDAMLRWYVSVVREVKEGKVLIHFAGWKAKWDEVSLSLQ